MLIDKRLIKGSDRTTE